jgi:signal transduction histidine kinase
MKFKPFTIRTKVLIPLGAFTVGLLAVLFLTEYKAEIKHLDEYYGEYFDIARKLFQSEIDKEASIIAGLAEILGSRTDLQKAFQRGDRDGLLAAALPSLEDLTTHYGVTHLYFHTMDKTCFLRTHKPAKYGDTVNRHMLDEAISRGEADYGMELGPFGTYTLRLVYPWRVDGRVIGYLELGKEIQRITPNLKTILDVDIAILISKCYLKRDGWEQGLAMTGRTGSWDRFSDFVTIDQTGEYLPELFTSSSNDMPLAGTKGSRIRYHHIGKTTYASSYLELKDAADTEVGTVFIIKDVTNRMNHIYQAAAFNGCIALWTGALVVGFFYFYVGRIERRLKDVNKQQQEEIAQRKFAEALLTEAMQRAEAANRAKTQFTSNMSHELRTPMNAIMGFTDLMLSEPLTDEQLDYLQTIHDSSQHLLKLINDVLDISKIESGKEQIQLSRCSLREMLGRLETLMGVNATAKGITFKQNLDADVPDEIVTDAKHLYQCLLNLVSNAIKFTDQGFVTLSVGVQDKLAGQWLEFEVRDTGIGIPAKKLETIFEAFEQADASTSRRFGGTGLGLAITRSLIEMMGGTIAVSSTEGSGSTFRFGLPLNCALSQTVPA